MSLYRLRLIHTNKGTHSVNCNLEPLHRQLASNHQHSQMNPY